MLPPVLLSVAPLVSAFMLPALLSRPSAFMSLAPLVSVSELKVLDFSPCGILVSCALLLDGIFSLDSDAFMPWESEPLVDSAPFMPEAPLSRCIVPDAAPPRSGDGAFCCTVEPADGCSRRQPRGVGGFSCPGNRAGCCPGLEPVPCAFAKPVPAISAATAAEIKKRLVIKF